MSDTPDPLKPGKIQGQNPNTPERMPGHTGFYEDGEADEADDKKDARGAALMESAGRDFPVAAGILFGLGLGGFFDGIVLHQVLQWHHMLSSWYPVNTIENLELNTFWDGIFHSATYLFVVAALFVLWRTAKRKHLYWSTKLLAGSMLIGFGLFNTVEGLINHHLLGVHHVNELVPPDRWVYWDVGFILWGVTMIGVGWWLLRAGKREGAPQEEGVRWPSRQ